MIELMQHHGIVVYEVVGRSEWPCWRDVLAGRVLELAAGRIQVYWLLAGRVLELAGRRIQVYWVLRCLLAGRVLELAGRRSAEWGGDAHGCSVFVGVRGDARCRCWCSVFDGVMSRDGLAPNASLVLDHALKDLEMLHDLIVSDPHAMEFELRVPHSVVVGHKVSRGVVHARGEADVFVFGVLLHAAEVGLVRAQEPAVRGGPEVAKGEGPLLDAVEAGDGGRGSGR